MQLKKSCYIATYVGSRKSATTFGDIPDCSLLVDSYAFYSKGDNLGRLSTHDDVIKWKHFPRY